MSKFLSILAICAIIAANNKAIANEDWIVDIPAPQAENAGGTITIPAPEEHLLPNKIYFFVHSMCQDCKESFIYIYTNHSDLNIPITDMKFHHNFELYKECVNKFKISNKELRLPLICMGDNFIMGWDAQSADNFERYLTAFKAQNEQK